MQSFDLSKFSHLKVNQYVSSACKGKYTRKEAYRLGGIGIGGLRYTSGLPKIDAIDTQERFRCNLEMYKSGLGIFVRSLSYNHLLSVPKEELLSISLVKPEDELKFEGFSFTKTLLSWGVPYHYARIMVLEHEEVSLHDTMLEILTSDGLLSLKVNRYNAQPIAEFFERFYLKSIFTSDVKTYRTV